MQDAKNKYFKKEYLIEAHFYVKGRFKLHVPDCVKSSSIPKFGLCSEETGSTYLKKTQHTNLPPDTYFQDTHKVLPLNMPFGRILVTTRGCQARNLKSSGL